MLAAIAHPPELLVLDEPSSGLDPLARGDILEAVIRTVSQDGRTVLFSSHLLDEVDRVCDCIALMHEGRIVETLTTEQLQTRYCEVVGHAADSSASLPSIDGAFGWQRTGAEWSAVLHTEVADRPDFAQTYGMVQRRELSLQRWFTARVAAVDEPSTPRLTHEVTTDA